MRSDCLGGEVGCACAVVSPREVAWRGRLCFFHVVTLPTKVSPKNPLSPVASNFRTASAQCHEPNFGTVPAPNQEVCWCSAPRKQQQQWLITPDRSKGMGSPPQCWVVYVLTFPWTALHVRSSAGSTHEHSEDRHRGHRTFSPQSHHTGTTPTRARRPQ